MYILYLFIKPYIDIFLESMTVGIVLRKNKYNSWTPGGYSRPLMSQCWTYPEKLSGASPFISRKVLDVAPIFFIP